MEFSPVNLDLSIQQRRKLLNNHPIQLKHFQIGSGSTLFHATHNQYKKLLNSHKNKKGMRIQFESERHLHKNLIDGSGFAQLLSKAKKLAITHLAPHAKKFTHHLIHQYAPQAQEMMQQYANNLIDSGANHASQYIGNDNSNFLKSLAKENANNYINSQYNNGLQFADQQLGEGINWKKVGRTLKNGFNSIKNPIIKPLLHSAIDSYTAPGLTALGTLVGAPELGLASPFVQNGLNHAVNGLGIKKKRITRKKKQGGALISSGY